MFQSIRFRIALLGVLPLLLALYFMLGNVVTKYHEFQQMNQLRTLTELASHISAYAHETQKERGATGISMGGGGTKYVTELAQQREATDAGRTALEEFIVTLDAAEYGRECEPRARRRPKRIGRGPEEADIRPTGRPARRKETADRAVFRRVPIHVCEDIACKTRWDTLWADGRSASWGAVVLRSWLSKAGGPSAFVVC